MKHLVFFLASFASLTAFQMMEKNPIGSYVLDKDNTVELKKDHTLKETHGLDWRTGMWKVSHDTIVIQDGLQHSNVPGKLYPYQGFYLIKKTDLQVGKMLYKISKK
jgi:hypothetical protein